MSLRLTDEQLVLQEVVRDFLTHLLPNPVLHDGGTNSTKGPDPVWSRLVDELDLVGLLVPEDLQGSGGSLADACVVVSEFGRRLYAGPYVSTAVLAVEALMASGDSRACAEWLPQIAKGERSFAIAGLQEFLDGDVERLATAWHDGDTWRLSGTAIAVTDAAIADTILVIAHDGNGAELFLVPASDVSVVGNEGIDLTRPLSTLTFDDSPGRRLGDAGSGATSVSRLAVTASIIQAAELVGTAEHCLETAVTHAQTRVQFGRPIGSFQAVKHRCASMLMDVEASRATVLYAAMVASAGDPEASFCASIANSECSESGFRVAAGALQILGGIGYTWEHPIHLYLRRCVASRYLLGAPSTYRERLLADYLASSNGASAEPMPTPRPTESDNAASPAAEQFA